MPTPRRRRWPAFRTSSGSPAASPRTAASRRLRSFFPRIRKAYLIGEAAPAFAATLEGKVPHVIAGTLDMRSKLAARDAASAESREPVGAVVAGLRLLRPVPQLRGARRRLPRSGPVDARYRETVGFRLRSFVKALATMTRHT